MTTRHLAVLLLPALLSSACVTATTTSRTLGEPDPGYARTGRVTSVRETIRREQGDPAAGAVAGAVVGGLLGSAIGGRVHYNQYGYGHYHGSPVGALFGAAGGAVLGAAASQGSAEERSYEVTVGFDDGGYATYVYRGYSPFSPGEAVVLTSQGLARM